MGGHPCADAARRFMLRIQDLRHLHCLSSRGTIKAPVQMRREVRRVIPDAIDKDDLRRRMNGRPRTCCRARQPHRRRVERARCGRVRAHRARSNPADSLSPRYGPDAFRNQIQASFVSAPTIGRGVAMGPGNCSANPFPVTHHRCCPATGSSSDRPVHSRWQAIPRIAPSRREGRQGGPRVRRRPAQAVEVDGGALWRPDQLGRRQVSRPFDVVEAVVAKVRGADSIHPPLDIPASVGPRHSDVLADRKHDRRPGGLELRASWDSAR